MVFGNLEREAKRIRYWDMLVKGQVRMVRRRQGGGYFTILTPPPGAAATRRVAFRSNYVHSAIGYPGLKYLPDLQDFRTKMQDFHHVVAAYEDHEHVYNQMRTRPGTVLIRGGGIVASRVLARLMDDREKYGLQTQIVHLFRTYIDGSARQERLEPTQGRQRLRLPGVQLSEVGVGGPAQVQDAPSRGRGPRQGL